MDQSKQQWLYKIVNRNGVDYIAKEIVVHRFSVLDSDDPVVAAGEPLYEWENSEAGKWVKAHAVEQPRWQRRLDPMAWAHEFIVVARLIEQDITYFTLTYK